MAAKVAPKLASWRPVEIDRGCAVQKYLPLLALSVLGLAACAPPYPGDQAGAQADAAGKAGADIAARDTPADAQAVLQTLKARHPELAEGQIRSSPVAGLYELQLGMNFGYVSQDGRYLISGDMVELDTKKQITEDRRRLARVQLLRDIGPQNMIEFAPSTPAKYTVTVFTDTDCGYCRMLHRQIAEYNADGIAVRYAFFPRSGENTPSFFVAEQVWCSPDRKAALTDAKSGKKLKAPTDCDNPIEQHLKAADALNLRGTPAIILANGELLPGYYPPADLLQILKEQDGSSAPQQAPTG